MCLSVYLEQLGSHGMNFYEIWYMSSFQKSVDKIQVSLEYDKNNRHFTWRAIAYMTCLAQFFVEWEMFHTKFVAKIKTHFMFSNFYLFIFFFGKSCRL